MRIKQLIEHLTQKQLEGYCRQQLIVAELLSVTEHLGECDDCRQRIESTMNGDATFLALRSEIFGDSEFFSPESELAHLTMEQTAQYVDQNLSGEELQIVGDHLTICEQCNIAVNDLRVFRNQIAPSLDREYSPAPVSPSKEVWWRRSFGSLSAAFRLHPAPAFGTALAILLFAVTGWLVWRTVREREPKQEVVVTPAPSSQPAPAPQQSPVPLQPEPVTVIAQLNDGKGQLSLDQQGKLSGADDLPPSYQSLVKKVLTNQRVEKSSQLNGLSRPSSALMGSDQPADQFSVMDPVGNVLMTNRPNFRWTPMEGAAGYVVEVYDSKFKLVVASPQVTRNSWVATQPLPWGNVYSWQVKAIKDGQEITSPGPPAPQAKFRILDRAKVNELANARRSYGSSHLVLGMLYAEAGLLKESEQELRMLLKANANSEVARSLLRQVQALRRRTE